jgi:protein tyrosine phosphatase (PTP) superfamily phosphohydrolase (DUF442 family)
MALAVECWEIGGMALRNTWIRRALAVCLLVLGAQQLWRHGHDYVLPREFVVVENGKLYRGGWQKGWPMRRIATNYKIKTVLALAHPDDHPLSQSERALCRELGVRWIHIPIVDQRDEANPKTLADLLDEAAAVLADSKNYPIFFHCHHGLNRASMAQIAYRTKYCGWTLDQATDEIAKTVGLIKVTHGPDYRRMVDYYNTHVLPLRARNQAAQDNATQPQPTEITAQTSAEQSALPLVR